VSAGPMLGLNGATARRITDKNGRQMRRWERADHGSRLLFLLWSADGWRQIQPASARFLEEFAEDP
jgi:hypothetical protein